MARTAGRFRLLEKPVAFPFFDVITNTPEGPVFDVGVDLEMYDGVVYIKAVHIEEMAEQLGFLSPVEALALQDRVKELEKEVEVLPQEIGNFTDELNDLVRRFHSSLRVSGDNPSVPDVEGTAGETPSDGGKSTDSTFDPFGQIIGLNLFKGPDDVPTDSSNAKPSTKSGAKG